jgi:hypothetical protein
MAPKIFYKRGLDSANANVNIKKEARAWLDRIYNIVGVLLLSKNSKEIVTALVSLCNEYRRKRTT